MSGTAAIQVNFIQRDRLLFDKGSDKREHPEVIFKVHQPPVAFKDE
jgi:hypothetical protein